MKLKDGKIRILHITQSYGGVQTYILNVIRNSDKQKYNYAVLCPRSELSRICKEWGVNVYCVNIKRSPHFLDIICLIKIIVVIIKYNPDILHVHSAKAGVLGRLASFVTRKKVIYTPHAFSYLGYSGFNRFIFRSIEKLFRSLTDVLLAVSNSEKEHAICELEYNAENVIVIPNSIELRHQKNDRHYKLCNTVGMIGRLIFQKNPLMFVNIALEIHAKYPQMKFFLLGEGYLDFLKKEVFYLIKKNKAEEFIKILKWGKYDIEQFYNEIEIFILTSRFEGLPFALLEAMERGIPCVATSVDGNKDVIDNGINGFLVEDNSMSDMIEKLSLLIEYKNLRENIGIAGKKRIDEVFNIEKNIKLIENVYYSICNKKISQKKISYKNCYWERLKCI